MAPSKALILANAMALTLINILAFFSTTNAQWLTQNWADRQTYVHLFEWKWKDIANECETFLGRYKYGAVQISPPNEHLMNTINVNGNLTIPWYVRYQPVSYKLDKSRGGTYQELADMINRCNKAGVRIIVDAVINHMTSVTKRYPGQYGVWSSAGSSFDGGAASYPAVPYYKDDFHNSKCNEDIKPQDYGGDAWRVRMCRLSSLIDIDQGRDNVRKIIAAYLNSLVDLGVAGFRVDAVKHTWPDDLQAIFNMVKNLREDIYGPNQRPFIVQEVMDFGGEAVKADQYLKIGRVTNFKYGTDLSAAVRKEKNFRHFGNFGPDWGYLADMSTLNFVDNHDTQRDNHPLTYKDGSKYIMANTYMLAWPYGYPSVMSSFHFTKKEQGCPTSGDPSWEPTSPPILQDETCSPTSGWVCEHRWPAIRRMSLFRGVTNGQKAENIETDEHRIAFRRGNKGFFALNNNDYPWERKFYTGMPQGTYCDVISGEADWNNKKCTGTTVYVDNGGNTQIKVDSGKTLAIHVEQRLN